VPRCIHDFGEIAAVRTRFIRTLLMAGAGLAALTATAAAQVVPSPPPIEWTLADVLKAALSQHPQIEAARARLAAAEGTRQAAGAWPNPMLTYWVENASLPGLSSSGGLDRESSVYGTLPLEPFLQRGSRVAQAGNESRAAQAAVTMAERQVAADAVHAFHRLALAQVAADAARDTLAAIEQVVGYLRNRVAQGAAPEGDLIRAEVERDRADTETAMSDVELIRAQASLRTWLGDAARTGDVRVTIPDWARERPTLASLADFTAHALAQRADLLVARARAESASGALALERTMIVRQLGASFGVKRMAGMSGFVGGLSFSVPLFDRNRGGIDRATGEQHAADLETRWMERTITTEVEADYQAAVRLVGQVLSLQPTFLGRAEESRRIALATYQEGATSLLQVFDASRALSEARLTYAGVLLAASESLFDLGIAAGYDAAAAAALGRSLTAPPARNTNGGSR
jgi:cobalt-zinc-cadmium efflux system outer membrane protein